MRNATYRLNSLGAPTDQYRIMLLPPSAVDALFAGHSLGTKLFVRARQRLFPFAKVLDHVPHAGRVLDVGCGHGVFSLLVATGRPQTQVVGVDPDVKKIMALERAAQSLGNLRFVCGELAQLDESGFDCAALLDVMIYLPPVKQIDLLAQVRERLKPGGTLLLAMNDTRPRWKFAVTYLQERCMTWSRLTRAETLHFARPDEMLDCLHAIGFAAEVVPLPTRGMYPHVMVVGKRTDPTASMDDRATDRTERVRKASPQTVAHRSIAER